MIFSMLFLDKVNLSLSFNATLALYSVSPVGKNTVLTLINFPGWTKSLMMLLKSPVPFPFSMNSNLGNFSSFCSFLIYGLKMSVSPLPMTRMTNLSSSMLLKKDASDRCEFLGSTSSISSKTSAMSRSRSVKFPFSNRSWHDSHNKPLDFAHVMQQGSFFTFSSTMRTQGNYNLALGHGVTRLIHIFRLWKHDKFDRSLFNQPIILAY